MTRVPERWDVGLWDQAHWDGQLGLDAGVGAIVLAPKTANLVRRRVYRLTAAPGLIVLAPKAANLVRKRVYQLTAVKGSIVLAGQAAILTVANASTMLASPGAIAVSLKPANLIWRRVYRLTAVKGTVVLAGNPVGLRKTRELAAQLDTIIVTGHPAELIYLAAGARYTLDASTGAFIVSGRSTALHHKKPPPDPMKTPRLTGELRFGHRVVLRPHQW